MARKAKASGTPAKFEATPEKVMTGARTTAAARRAITAQATQKPMTPPRSAEARLIRIEIQ